ncbi:MAG: ribosome silencing factor [Gammaproteobacteria bacterium]|nr:ribosome silencing factor [Gammaproteobacteria bacterium]
MIATIVDALDDLKAQDIIPIDVRERTSLTDAMIIATGTSSRHIKALGDRVEERLKADGGEVLSVEASDQWVLVDADVAMVHIMTKEARDHYQLERLWDMSVGQLDPEQLFADAS